MFEKPTTFPPVIWTVRRKDESVEKGGGLLPFPVIVAGPVT
jgi:hypothetical protein